jgi:uncharacterized cupin superfamily protein
MKPGARMSANPKQNPAPQHPIVNIDEVELQRRPPERAPIGAAAERFDARVGMIAPKLGAQKLGYNLTAVPPGKRAYPFHNHRVNEEMFYVIEGTGEVRIGAAVYSIRPGDIIACPPGGKETAHQIVNTGKSELKYLAISTKLAPEICDYPDSGKFAVLSETIRFVSRENHQLDYWEGE